MPAKLMELSETQDALVVFINECCETRGEEIQKWLEQRFGSSREYLYLEGNTITTGSGLIQYITQEIRRYHVYLPSGRRLIVCRYLALRDLTAEWMNQYCTVAEEIEFLLPPQGGGHHYYVSCFQYEVGKLLGERKKEVLELLTQFGKKNFSFYHSQYLFYKPIPDELDSQEQAMVQLLYMWSRVDYQKLMRPFDPEFMKQFRITAYMDYLESEAGECRRKIEEMKSWLQQEADPNLSNLFWLSISKATEQAARLEEAISRFNEISNLYPVRVTDYKKHLFRRFEKIEERTLESVLERRKQDYIRDIRQELLKTTDLGEILGFVKKKLHYPDLRKLKEMLGNSNFSGEFLQRMRTKESILDEEQEFFLKEWCGQLKEEILAVFPKLEDEKEKREMEIGKQSARLEKVGKYQSLEDCLARMHEEAGFMTPVDVLPNGIDTFVLVAGRCSSNWYLEGYDVVGVDQVYSCPSIAPAEIVMLREASYIDLAGDGALEELGIVFH